jgi:hypothetical protein
MSEVANKRVFRESRTLSIEELDKCLSSPEVQSRFKRYITSGVGHEGPLPEEAALEEALMDVFVGAKSRGFRLYQKYATAEHVKRMKRIMADTLDGMVIKDFIPDLVGLRARLRGLSDIGGLSSLLVAEQAGRNDEGEPRQDALGMIIARIKAVQDNSEKVREHSGPTEEELAEVTSAR